MKIYELIIISFSLAMDAFSVSICKGLKLKSNVIKYAIVISIIFSLFQVMMPILGFYLGTNLNKHFLKFNKLIAFGLLFVIGINMIKESLSNSNLKSSFDIIELLGLGLATSVDAFSIGLAFSLFEINLIKTLFLIGIITFILSFIGVIIGYKIGDKYEKFSEILGGIILITMSLKFLLEHFNIF